MLDSQIVLLGAPSAFKMAGKNEFEKYVEVKIQFTSGGQWTKKMFSNVTKLAAFVSNGTFQKRSGSIDSEEQLSLASSSASSFPFEWVAPLFCFLYIIIRASYKYEQQIAGIIIKLYNNNRNYYTSDFPIN